MTNDDFNQPLAGLTVMVTRPEHQAESLAEPLRRLGAEVQTEPMIEIVPPNDWLAVDRSIERIAAGEFATLVFVSVNGARSFIGRATEIGQADNLAKLEVVSIGSGTAEILSNLGVPSQKAPGNSDSTAIANFLIQEHARGRILIVRANRGSDLLPTRLAQADLDFEQVVAYRSIDRQTTSAASVQAMADGEIDWVTATSSAIANSLIQLFGDSLKQTKIVSISPTTSSVLRDNGYAPAAEASEYNMNGIISAILSARGE